MKRIRIDVTVKLSVAACLFGLAVILGAIR